MFTRIWIKRVVERATKTGAQVLAGLLAASEAVATGPDWKFIGVTTGTAMLVSVLTSIITTPLGPDPQDPSAV